VTRAALRQALEGAGVSGEARDRLLAYLELLQRWSKAQSLVSYRSDAELVARQVTEAFAALDHLPASAPGVLVDVGSGAGFPGVALLSMRPTWRGVLLEPRQKRWAFLRAVARELGLGAEVVRERYQDWTAADGIDRVVARALGGWEDLLEWARSQLAPDGQVVLWLAEDDARRLSRLEGWHVLSSPLMSLERGTVTFFRRCFT
jgi:16S rRNA (guanine527-N7)-methyltransferase